MQTYTKNDIFTIELENEMERKAFIMILTGNRQGSMVLGQLYFDMARELLKKLREVEK